MTGFFRFASGRRRRRGGIAGDTVLAAGAIVMPPLAIFAPLGLAPLLIVVAVGVVLFDSRRALGATPVLIPLIVLLAALALWALASTAWSILPQHSLVEGLRLLAISIGGLIILGAALDLAPSERHRIGAAAVLGLVIAILLVAIERASDGALTRLALRLPTEALPLTRFDRGTTTLILSLWPAAIALGHRHGRAPAILLALATAAIVIAMDSTTAKLALAAGFIGFFLALAVPRLVTVLLAAGVLALAVALPLATPSDQAVVAFQHQHPTLKESAIHRLLIWRFTADRIGERPVLGWGMDASRALPGGHQDLAATIPGLHFPPGAEALPLHPHDAALQWEVELGIPGAALALALIIWSLWRVGWVARLARTRRAGALAWAATALPIAMLSYGVWQEWWLSCLWLSASLYAAAGAGGVRGQINDG